MSSLFDESKIFSRDLSIWDGFLLDAAGDEQNYVTEPLDFFTAASLGETEIVENYLQRKLMKPNAKNRSGWAAIMYAAYMGHDGTVDILMRYGADSNIKTRQGYTPLILAAMCGNCSVIKLLAKHNVEIDTCDNQGWSALFHASSAGHQQTTDLLLQYGANVEIRESSQGLTPLMEAAASGHELVVEHLIKKGANVLTKDKGGDDAMTLAIEYGHVKIASIIGQNKQYKADSMKKQASSAQHQSNNNNNKCNLSGGPSIHAGPKAFAQMTGLGSDGKPHPHNAIPMFLQDNQQPTSDYMQPSQIQQQHKLSQPKWNGPKNLETLLKRIDCSKYANIFEQHDIDLHVFLTLTETDLKEIGISLFGPRRKMVSAIARSMSEIEGVVVGDGCRAEMSYADSIQVKLAKLQDRIKEVEMENMEFKSMYAQERQLRKITEGVLMEQKEIVGQLRITAEKLDTRHNHLVRIIDDVRAQVFSQKMGKLQLASNKSNSAYSPTSPQTRYKNSDLDKTSSSSKIEISDQNFRELEILSQNTGDCLHELRNFIEKSTVTSSPLQKSPDS